MSNYALRLPESLKQAAKRIAASDDTTMNQFFVVAIAEKISAMETAKFFEKRAASADPKSGSYPVPGRVSGGLNSPIAGAILSLM